MDLEAFKRGDMAVLGRVVDDLANDAWRLARRGFVTRADERRIWVRGVDAPEDAERLTVHCLATILTPSARGEVNSIAEIRIKLLEEARVRYVDDARANARALTLEDEEALPLGVEDLDAIITRGGDLGAEDPPADPGAEQRAAADLETINKLLGQLGERDRQVVELRWKSNKTDREVAAVFTCGAAAVRERERRIRRRAHHALRRAGHEGSELGQARVDSVLSSTSTGCVAPPITLERVRTDVLKRTFQDEPAPFGQRAAWAVGFSAITFALWALMVVGVLPYYGDDKHPEPRVEVVCEGDCRPGGEAQVRVLAPRDARTVGLIVVDAAGQSHPLLVDPAGRSITLPFGARNKLSPIAYPAKFPATLRAGAAVDVLAVFSEEELSAASLAKQGDGKKGVLTASTTAVLK